jgi:hypothetical protein
MKTLRKHCRLLCLLMVASIGFGDLAPTAMKINSRVEAVQKPDSDDYDAHLRRMKSAQSALTRSSNFDSNYDYLLKKTVEEPLVNVIVRLRVAAEA